MDSHFTYQDDMIEKDEPEYQAKEIRIIIGLIAFGLLTGLLIAFGFKIPAIICFALHSVGWVMLYREDTDSVIMDHCFERIESKQELDEKALSNRKMEAEMNYRVQNAEETEKKFNELNEKYDEKVVELENLRGELEALRVSAAADRESLSKYDKAALATLLPMPETEEDFEPVDIIAVARTAVAELHESAENAGIKVELSTICDKLLVKADPGRIRILFRNIIDNSIKYMQIAGSLVITISTIGDDIFIVLKDNGEGLSEEETDRVFELNFQGTNRKSGNGLGLTQAKAIVDFYGGTIYAKSNSGKGMAIYIQLPATSDSSKEGQL